MYRFLFLVVLLVGCGVPSKQGGEATPEDVAHVSVTLGKVVALDDTPNLPDNKPSSDVCENCGGKGRLGDGTVSVDCPACVDGKVIADKSPFPEPSVVSSAKPEPVIPTITIYKSSSCIQCDKWMIQEAPQFEKVGWKIEPKYVDGDRSFRTLPTFHVKDYKKEFTFEGYMTVAKFTDEYRK